MPKRLRTLDDAQNALRVVEEAIGEKLHPEPKKKEKDKDPFAVALGRRGGRIGGKRRAEKLTAEELSAIGDKGAQGRWPQYRAKKSLNKV